MLNCLEMAELCSRELEEPLQFRERVSMAAHLMVCTGCRNYRTHIFRLRSAARHYAQGEALYDGEEPRPN